MIRSKKFAAEERVVRLMDEKGAFRGTATLLDSNGWVLTCGHAFNSLGIADGVSLGKKIPWTIQTGDGQHHKIEFLEEKFDDECLFDYALLKSSCKRNFPERLWARRNLEEHRASSMHGFSGNNSWLLKVNGEIRGPTSNHNGKCEQRALQLHWENFGTYAGFSGAPIIVNEARVGPLVAGIHTKELERGIKAQVGTPMINILNRSRVFSTAVAELSDIEYRRAGFVLEAVHELDLLGAVDVGSIVSGVFANIYEAYPKLAGQLSKKKIASRLRKRIAEGKKVVGFAVTTRRPNKVEVRSHLAVHFGRAQWRQNMCEAVTEEELRQLRHYREFVRLFLFKEM